MATKKIDPRVFVPLVSGYEHEERDFQVPTGGQGDAYEGPISTTGLQPPESVMVVDQVFRKGADGKTVVDLVLEVEDVPGASEYEVRTSRI